MDNKPLELEALDCIKSKVASYGYKYANPNYDENGGDFLILKEKSNDDFLMLKFSCQSKGRRIFPNGSNICIPKGYVKSSLLVFVYLRPQNPDDSKVYLYTEEDIKSNWNTATDCYRLNIDKDFLQQQENDKFIFDYKRSSVIDEILDRKGKSIDGKQVSAISDSDFYFLMWQKMAILPPLEYLRFFNTIAEFVRPEKFIFLLSAIVIQNQTVDDNSMRIDWAFFYLKSIEGDMEEKIDFVHGKEYFSNVAITYSKTWVEEMIKEEELLGYHLHIGDREEYVDAYVLRDGRFCVNYKKL